MTSGNKCLILSCYITFGVLQCYLYYSGRRLGTYGKSITFRECCQRHEGSDGYSTHSKDENRHIWRQEYCSHHNTSTQGLGGLTGHSKE